MLPPRIPDGSIAREALVQRVTEGLSRRLVSIIAGAGYGKSTLLAQALERSPHPWVWLACDGRMGDAGVFFAHLAAGIEQRFPGFGAQLAQGRGMESQAAALCNEILATVPDDIVVAIDDVHLLDGTDGAAALALLVRELPPQVHLAISGRISLTLPLARLRAAGEVKEFSERELSLSTSESLELLRNRGLTLTDVDARELHRRTEGWVTGIVLAAQAGGTAPDPVAPGDAAHHFDYMAEEVFYLLSDDLKGFLLRTAILERFSIAVASAVSGVDARPIVDELTTRHLFILRLGATGEMFRYHHLFAEFLQRRLIDAGLDRQDLHRRAADAWSAEGSAADAVHHYLEAGASGDAVDALEPVVEAMVRSPDAPRVQRWLDQMPDELWNTRPALLLARATLFFLAGEYERALDALEHALDRLTSAADHERAAAAVFALGRAATTAGRSRTRGLTLARKYLPRIDSSARMLPAARLTMAHLYGYASSYDRSEKELQAAVALPAAAAIGVFDRYVALLRAFMIDHPRGRSDDALRELDVVIVDLERREAEDALVQLPYAFAYRAIVLADIGRYEDALHDARRLLEAAERKGLAAVAAPVCAWIRFAALAGLERWEDLEAEIDRTSPVFAGLGGAVRGYLYQTARARLAAHRGDAGEVERQVRAARAGLAEHDYAHEEATVSVDLALAAWEVGLGDLARETAEGATAAARRARGSLTALRAAIACAVVSADEAEVDAHLERALRLTGRHGYQRVWSRRHRDVAAPLLIRALNRGLGPRGAAARVAVECGREVFAQCVEEVVAPAGRGELAAHAMEGGDVEIASVGLLVRDDDPGVRAAAARSEKTILDRPRPPIRLAMLGGLAVWRGDAPVPGSAFVRRKARGLLAALASARGPVHRELLLEWFWPDLPPDRGLAALYVTLHDLRRALEPGLGRGTPSTLVVVDGEAYRFVLHDIDTWDVAHFLELSQWAAGEGRRGALEGLLAAESAYGGEFLPEWPYEDWAQPLRLEVDQARRQVLERLAVALVAADRPAEAVTRYKALLAMDGEYEAWHRGLMRAYAQSGEIALALRQYHACRARLRRGQGTEPGPETRALYSEILGAGVPREPVG
jgi:DNA-binding SARP family transcriptional activator/tetratricopeptide (TPR) repeat protein